MAWTARGNRERNRATGDAGHGINQNLQQMLSSPEMGL
jgi:hypothetical protein